MTTLTCPHCSASFAPLHSRQKYCSDDCRRRAKAERSRDANRARMRKNRGSFTPRPCEECGEIIPDPKKGTKLCPACARKRKITRTSEWMRMRSQDPELHAKDLERRKKNRDENIEEARAKVRARYAQKKVTDLTLRERENAYHRQRYQERVATDPTYREYLRAKAEKRRQTHRKNIQKSNRERWQKKQKELLALEITNLTNFTQNGNQ